jgi:hypothetical protein
LLSLIPDLEDTVEAMEEATVDMVEDMEATEEDMEATDMADMAALPRLNRPLLLPQKLKPSRDMEATEATVATEAMEATVDTEVAMEATEVAMEATVITALDAPLRPMPSPDLEDSDEATEVTEVVMAVDMEDTAVGMVAMEDTMDKALRYSTKENYPVLALLKQKNKFQMNLKIVPIFKSICLHFLVK